MNIFPKMDRYKWIKLYDNNNNKAGLNSLTKFHQKTFSRLILSEQWRPRKISWLLSKEFFHLYVVISLCLVNLDGLFPLTCLVTLKTQTTFTIYNALQQGVMQLHCVLFEESRPCPCLEPTCLFWSISLRFFFSEESMKNSHLPQVTQDFTDPWFLLLSRLNCYKLFSSFTNLAIHLCNFSFL